MVAITGELEPGAGQPAASGQWPIAHSQTERQLRSHLLATTITVDGVAGLRYGQHHLAAHGTDHCREFRCWAANGGVGADAARLVTKRGGNRLSFRVPLEKGRV
jgi:hypothetical protein